MEESQETLVPRPTIWVRFMKTGGTSLNRWLQSQNALSSYTQIIHTGRRDGWMMRGDAVLRRNVVHEFYWSHWLRAVNQGRHTTCAAPSFTVVRNPWTRIRSAFEFVKSKGWIRSEANLIEAIQTPECGQCHGETIRVCAHSKQCKVHVHLNYSTVPVLFDRSGNRTVDHIIPFESLEESLAEMAKHEGWKVRLQLPHYRRGQYDHDVGVREYFTTKERRIIEKIWGPEIDAFGYDYTGPPSHIPEKL